MKKRLVDVDQVKLGRPKGQKNTKQDKSYEDYLKSAGYSSKKARVIAGRSRFMLKNRDYVLSDYTMHIPAHYAS